ncbi:phage tail protein I [uncultured Campylobacter sp.]|uniref:phage tail protein I n=1 Tax=uncultured Campylobacter sp. TaxID=218934 RepID=UPI002624F301|nr:phage tail protein I [uncultured Campylobacter sp.]
MSILPIGKPKFDKKLDDLFGVRLDGLDIGTINILAHTAPASILPHLAASFDVDIEGLSEYKARELICRAFEIKRLKGTLYSVRTAVQAVDSGAAIIEGNLSQKYDSSLKYDGARRYGSNNHWAEYSIISSMSLDVARASQIRRRTAKVAPARCVLVSVDSRGELLYNGNATYNAEFNYGTY